MRGRRIAHAAFMGSITSGAITLALWFVAEWLDRYDIAHALIFDLNINFVLLALFSCVFYLRAGNTSKSDQSDEREDANR